MTGRVQNEITYARLLGLAIIATIVCVYAWWPMFDLAPATPELDGRYFYQLFLIGKSTFRFFGEWPMWNPYDCKGVPMWDHPEGSASSPLLLAMLNVDPLKTYHWWNVVHMIIGWVGMWLLVRDEYALSRFAAFAAACMWTFGVCHTTQYCGAHEMMVAFWTFPLLLFLWRRAEFSTGGAIAFGIALALVVYDGATYPLPFSLIVLLLDAVLRIWPPRRLLRILKAGVIGGAVGFSLSAARLLPVLDRIASQKREIVDTDSLLHWSTLKNMWTAQDMSWMLYIPVQPGETASPQQYMWGEYLAYIGYASVLVAMIGLLVSVRREWRTVVLAALVFTFMLGHFSDWAPWSLLTKHVFVFKAMRVPSRFRIVFQCFIALFMALAIDRVPQMIERRFGRRSFWNFSRVAVLGVALVGVGDMVGFGHELIRLRFRGMPTPALTTEPNTRFFYTPDQSKDLFDTVRENSGWLGCRSNAWPSNSDANVWTGDVIQARAVGDSAKVDVGNRTSSTFSVDVNVKQESVILLNSGYATGWESNVGEVIEWEKLLAVRLPPGYHRVRMQYWPRRMNLGIGISIAGAAGILLYIAWILRGIFKRDEDDDRPAPEKKPTKKPAPKKKEPEPEEASEA
jgi:hypothetical protein